MFEALLVVALMSVGIIVFMKSIHLSLRDGTTFPIFMGLLTLVSTWTLGIYVFTVTIGG